MIDVQNAARGLGLELVVLRAGREREIYDSFAKVAEQRIGNMGTAKAMGLTIPAGLLAIADEVIE